MEMAWRVVRLYLNYCSMKVALIIPANVYFAPYVKIYTKILDRFGVCYDIISWNREGRAEEGIQFSYQLKNRNPISLCWGSYCFASFVKKCLKKTKYERLVVFTSQSAIFLSRYLKRRYKGKYIFDYRDLSIEQKAVFHVPFNRVLKHSYINVVSSLAFVKYLPQNYNYILSHNFNVDEVRKALTTSQMKDLKSTDGGTIDVLTIGGIRDYESNVQVVEHLANVDNVTVRFVGKGCAAPMLERFAKSTNANNVTFEGYYPKEKEKQYINDCTFLNIFYPRKPSHDTALSNRFYNSLIYKRPMITTINTLQGDYASKYKVGIAIENCIDLDVKLRLFIKNMDVESYIKNCNLLLKEFLADYDTWENKVHEFIKVD